jgi:pyruvate/2-oxoglutarate dehydrogenase complex dihydrolipoamide dehydrogenase (E3) component
MTDIIVVSAIQEGFVAATNAVLGPTMPFEDHVSTSADFTEPYYAQTGLTEAKARETHDVVTYAESTEIGYVPGGAESRPLSMRDT